MIHLTFITYFQWSAAWILEKFSCLESRVFQEYIIVCTTKSAKYQHLFFMVHLQSTLWTLHFTFNMHVPSASALRSTVCSVCITFKSNFIRKCKYFMHVTSEVTARNSTSCLDKYQKLIFYNSEDEWKKIKNFKRRSTLTCVLFVYIHWLSLLAEVIYVLCFEFWFFVGICIFCRMILETRNCKETEKIWNMKKRQRWHLSVGTKCMKLRRFKVFWPRNFWCGAKKQNIHLNEMSNKNGNKKCLKTICLKIRS